jgi:hypothetical protein
MSAKEKAQRTAAGHTPGPWTEKAVALVDGTDEHYRTIEAGIGFHSQPAEDYAPGFNICGFIHPKDAALIAAAPELLDACYMALRGVPDYDVIRAAIAKAEGRA